MSVHKLEMKIGNKTLSFETGRMAKLADGAVLGMFEDTVVLATVVSAKAKKDLDFMPLSVDYQEKAYSAGKIPGGFFKREGRLGEKEILTCRLIDRPIRPLFPKGYCHETQVIVTVLSADKGNCADLLGINASSLALAISDIPFAAPVGAVRVGRVNNEFIFNPTFLELADSDLELIVVGTKDAVVMVEGGAKEVSETVMLDAIYAAHEIIKEIVAQQEKMVELAGKPKREFILEEIDEELVSRVSQFVLDGVKSALTISAKNERKDALSDLKKSAMEEFNPDDESAIAKNIKSIVQDVIKTEMRQSILSTKTRIDGRGLTDIRPITCEAPVMPRTHGSSLFTRGETQSLSVVTLGTSDDEQRLDTIDGDSSKSFMLHYNFPPYSVGEVKPMRGPGRREIGHGALAERALKVVLPEKSDFQYTIRIVSEILESNGSSSMATVCASSLAMMDAGVPIKTAVSGIAMGLIKEGDDYAILSDILGDEDHLGDMDFKVAGTENGVTALQMDMKIQGISREILLEALMQAKEGKKHILGIMNNLLPEARSSMSDYAPRILTLQVKQSKIRDIIGPGGKVIRDIVDRTGVKIDIDDSGQVNIFSADSESVQAAVDIIEKLTEEAVIGKIYKGKVAKITDFGAFVDLFGNVCGLVHISQLVDYRVNSVKDILSEGDEVMVKVLAIDAQGKIRLSRKDAMAELEADKK